jgi:tRNA-modifying protein YgfZ
MPPVVLPRVNCVLIEGADARRFAQSQFSGDVQQLSAGQWQWNAWLDARGRVQALMHLADVGDDRLLAVLRGGDVENMRAGLGRYLLRSQASVTASTFGGYVDAPLEMGRVETDGQDLVIGYGDRSLRLGQVRSQADPATSNSWRLAEILAGWPSLPAGEPQFLPPALGLERLGAISFEKGCYPGQEITARLHYRGGHKFRLYHLHGPTPVESGATCVSDDGGPVRILAAASSERAADLLAVAPMDMGLEINILKNIYKVISIFDA